jgi:glutamyl-tRNA reductase
MGQDTGLNGSSPELFVLGTSHSVAPAVLRERMGADVDEVYGGLSPMLEEGGAVSEAVVVSTCGRLEVYGVSMQPEDARLVLRDLIARRAEMSVEDLDAHSYWHLGGDAVTHLFRVAAGLDSAVHGEAQILGQVRDALHHPQALATAGPLLSRLFQNALSAGKRVRRETEIGRGSASFASAALTLLRAETGSLASRTALVLGAGDTGALVARLLRKAGVGRLIIANRTEARAHEVAAALNAEGAGLEGIRELLVQADIIVGAVAGRDALVSVDDVPLTGRRRRELRTRYFLDLGHPRNFDPRLGERPDIRLWDLEHIAHRVEGARQARRTQLPRAEAIVAEEADGFLGWLRSRETVPVLRAVREQVLALARREADRRSRGRTEDEREELRRFARALARTLLHSPTVALRDADLSSPEGQWLLKSATSLFGVSSGSNGTSDETNEPESNGASSPGGQSR